MRMIRHKKFFRWNIYIISFSFIWIVYKLFIKPAMILVFNDGPLGEIIHSILKVLT